MIFQKYKDRVDLLLLVLPYVAKEKIFALKGGTAINLFIRNLPRLSVDIDLHYIEIKDRHESLQEIESAISRIKTDLDRHIRGINVIPSNPEDLCNAVFFMYKIVVHAYAFIFFEYFSLYCFGEILNCCLKHFEK